jgi:hypothetical protein
MRRIALAVLAALLAVPLLAVGQTAPATSMPYTDNFSATGALNSSWAPVLGLWSGPMVEFGGYALSRQGTIGVESFVLPLAPTPQGIQAKILWVGLGPGVQVFPSITLDQDPSGGAIALEPSANGIYSVGAKSGPYPGVQLCAGTSPVTTDDTFSLTKAAAASGGFTYTATDVTTGQAICSVDSFLHQGVPGIEVDNRYVGTESDIGPVTITGQLATVTPPVVSPPSILITVPVAPDPDYTVVFSGVSFIAGTAPSTWTFTCAAPVATTPPATTSGAPSIQIAAPVAPATDFTVELSNYSFIPGISPGAWIFTCSAPLVAASQ